MKYKVIRPHRGGDTEALIVSKGESLRYERKPTLWPGWIWCTASNGTVGWVPESWVELSSGSCVMLRDYNSTELCVREGESLEVEFTESSWAWGRTSRGDYGWVPVDVIEPERSDTA